ncbi:DUF4326 domain-containing protein [Kribbella sp. NPDC059898]|uniref:DUF4326 domain-containing protein n=1 Tax=Kribbella sp. NPDC059898 TaxID=3346995 RepID=UPI0036631F30
MKRGLGIQRRRTPGWRLPDGAVIVDRTSSWGNPFTTKDILAEGVAATEGEARAIAVRRYADWLDGNGPDDHPLTPKRSVSRAWILAHLEELAGKVLACTCPVDELPCHRDELARRAAERAVYAERAQLVALVSACFWAARAVDPGEPMCPDVIYLETPQGQLSWHLAAVDVERFFRHVELVDEGHERAQWDGHSTTEKYRRISELTQQLAAKQREADENQAGATMILPRLNPTDWEHINEALTWLKVSVRDDPDGWPEVTPASIEITWEKTVVRLPPTSRLLAQPGSPHLNDDTSEDTP